jgi:hypothetical protein
MKEILMRLMIFALLVALTGLVMACGQANEAEEPTGDGIQVHGHWTVTVTDPDGTVARVHEFDNALLNGGGALLAALLTGEIRIQKHVLHIYRPMGWDCAEVTEYYGGYKVYSRIPAVMPKESAANKANTLMLSGVCTVQYKTTPPTAVSQIMKVATGFAADSAWNICNGDLCYDLSVGAPVEFTEHVETIPVANGQVVAFNIVFSFE